MWLGWVLYKDRKEGFLYILGNLLWWIGAIISIVGFALLILIAFVSEGSD